MSDPIIIDGDQIQAEPARLAKRLPRRPPTSEPRYLLTMTTTGGRKMKPLEAKCPEMGPLLELSWQLDGLGYTFVRLERLDLGPESR